MNTNNYVIVGKISTAFGVKGWVKVISFTDPIENLATLSPWYINSKAIAIEECKKHGDTLIAKLTGCDDRDKALLLRGKEISILREQLPPLTNQEYYWHDLKGLRVFTTDGELLGTVDYLFETGANDVMAIKDEHNKECYVPFLMDQVVKKVDLVEKIIEVEWDFDF